MITPAALLAAFDANQWSAVTVMTWDGFNVILPTYAAGEGLFFDLLHFLNGRAQGAESLSLTVPGNWTAAGTCAIGIDPTTGRVFLQSSLIDFTITASASNTFLGFLAAGHALVGGAPPHRLVAPNAYQTGPTFAGGLTIDPVGTAAYTVGADRWMQDPITAIRARGIADADDDNAAGALEALIIAASGEASVRVGLNADGKVVFAWENGIGNPGPPVWVSTTFRDAMGFSGNESTLSSGNVRYRVGDYLPQGVIVFPDGIRDDKPTASTTGKATLMLSGAYGASSYGTRKGRVFEFEIRGPTVDTTHYLQWLERVVQYLTPGAECSVYPVWGRPQRRLSPLRVTVSQAAHTILYTTAPTWAPGDHGRYRGRVAIASAQEHEAAFQDGSRTWYRVTVRLTDAD